jgi:hypothetical protein
LEIKILNMEIIEFSFRFPGCPDEKYVSAISECDGKFKLVGCTLSGKVHYDIRSSLHDTIDSAIEEMYRFTDSGLDQIKRICNNE